MKWKPTANTAPVLRLYISLMPWTYLSLRPNCFLLFPCTALLYLYPRVNILNMHSPMFHNRRTTGLDFYLIWIQLQPMELGHVDIVLLFLRKCFNDMNYSPGHVWCLFLWNYIPVRFLYIVYNSSGPLCFCTYGSSSSRWKEEVFTCFASIKVWDTLPSCGHSINLH